MNWTGGRLSRSRFAKGSLTAKQRDYFAKARAKLQHGRPPPPEISFFEFGEWMPERKAVDFSPYSTRKVGSSPIQRTLDQFQNTKPLAKRLEGLKERREPQKRKRTPLQETRNPAQPQTPKRQTAEPIVIGSSPSSSGSANDFPPPRCRPPHSSSSEDILSAPSIEAKRRRLLEMDDWVGVDRPAMKPVKIKFADPADTDLIGKRRRLIKTNHRNPADKRRPVARAAISVKRPHEILKARDQYYPEVDISVRIGSAVDRNDGRASIKDNSRLSVLSDELLDGEIPHLAHEQPPSVPVFTTPGPAPIRLSDHTYRELLTPSAFMDHSSSSAEAADRAKRLGRHQQTSSLIKGAGEFKSNGIDELYDWAWPKIEKEQAQEKPSFRLVFDDTPTPYAQRAQGQGSSPIVRDFAFAEAQRPAWPLELPAAGPFNREPWNTLEGWNARASQSPKYAEWDVSKGNTDARAARLVDVVPQLITAASDNLDLNNVDNDQIHSDPKVENLTITTPPSAMASAQILTEFQDRMASNTRLENGITRTLHDIETRFARETGKALPLAIPNEDPRAIGRAGQLRQDQSIDAGNEKGLYEDPTRPGPAEVETLSPRAPPEAATTKAQRPPTEPSASIDWEPQVSLLAENDEEALKAADDEEATWRRFIFGDDEDSNEYTFEEPGAPSSPHHSPLTQPSLLAEAATSPLKQNPHLADTIFDASTSTVAFRSPTQTYTENSPLKDSTPSSPPMPPPPNSSDPPTLTQPSLPRNLIQNPITSSLLGEAGSASQQNPSLSSDELHRPPDRLPGSQGTHREQESRGLAQNHQQPRTSGTQTRAHNRNLQKEKIVFKKPTRYVGSHSSDPMEPVVLGGRVLRSGRRVGDIGVQNGKGAKRKGKGKGKGKGKRRWKVGQVDRERSDDDDDDDDIVDD